MKVKIILDSARLTGVGRVVHLPDSIAKNYIDGGYCLPVEDDFFVLNEKTESEVDELPNERSDT